MCTSDLCNANDYNIHIERGNQLFAESLNPSSSPNLIGGSSPKASPSSNRTIFDPLEGSTGLETLPGMKSVVSLSSSSSSSSDSLDPLMQKVESKFFREGVQERQEVLWTESGLLGEVDDVVDDDDDESRRTPRQIRPQGKCVLHDGRRFWT